MKKKKVLKRKARLPVGFCDGLKKIGLKSMENMVSVKFYILIISTVFLYIGKLSENLWQETVLVVAGLRAVNEVASMFKKQPAAEAVAEEESEEPKEK